ncbi:MAG: rhomboid family intramembrane serine protease [Planctomycetota bacterium]
MRGPSLSTLLQHKVTTGTSLLAVAATVLWSAGYDVAVLFTDVRAFHGEPWRLVTSALPHVGVLHILFNLFWLVVLGTRIERALGPLRTLAMYSLLAAGSEAAEYAILDGGVGLSGVCYGLFAFLWVAGRSDQRFAGAIDRTTMLLFVGWFFLCVILTVTRILPVGNVAHLVGALLGAALAMTVVRRGGQRRWFAALTVGLTLLIGLAATVLRPTVTFSESPGGDAAWIGSEALMVNDNERAAQFLTIAIQMNPREWSAWFNLGIARHRLEQLPQALAAYEQAATLAPENDEVANVVAGLKEWLKR